MTLGELRDWFKAEFEWSDAISIGKIDRDTDKAICFYPSQSGESRISTVGGKNNCSYRKRKVTVLLRYGTNAAIADKTAQAVYDFFNENEGETGSRRFFIVMRYSEPVSLGADNDGIYEYTYDLDIVATEKQ